MKLSTFQMGFEIKMDHGPVNTPHQFVLWSHGDQWKEYTPTATLKYMNDALLGMNFHWLNQYKFASPEEKNFVTANLDKIDPYFAIYNNSAARLIEFKKHDQARMTSQAARDFEKSFSAQIDNIFSHEQVNFKFLDEALNSLATFEKENRQVLIYNFELHFSDKFTRQLLSFYSFLFHMRTIVALNYNNHVDDSTFECLKCDSISDYLPKTDFTVNDALLYWQFKKLATPFTGSLDVRVEKLFINPMEQSFLKYNHNACSLINNLPEKFLTVHSAVQLEEHLHQIQMDWLLGSSSGLLFRLREELYGIKHGYDKIFWPEANPLKSSKNTALKFFFELSEGDFSDVKKAG